MMKILLWRASAAQDGNPGKVLSSAGVVVLEPRTDEEALQLLSLHGNSVDLAIVGSDGLDLVRKLKADASQADLPLLIVAPAWSEAQCAAHQDTAEGANAYLSGTYTIAGLVDLIEGVTGERPAVKAATATPPPPKETTAATRPTATANILPDSSMILEDASSGPIHTGKAEDGPGIELVPHGNEPIAIEMPTMVMESPSVALEIAGAPSGPSSPSSMDSGSAIEMSLPNIEVLELSESGLPTPPTAPTELSPPSGPRSTDAASLVAELPTFDLAGEAAAAAAEAAPTALPNLPEAEVEGEIPYLFNKSTPPPLPQAAILAAMGQPIGDAVVPGGAAHSPDLETLKKYLLLREQDVAALSGQLKAAKDQVSNLDKQLRDEKAKVLDLSHTVQEQKRRLDDYARNQDSTLEAVQTELAELKFQLKAKADKAKVLEVQVREAADETEKLKERVRIDIRKIRVREKELENKLEIMKKDSEALISARENKIVELKRKLDLVEFNMDLLQEQHAKEKDQSAKLKERLSKALQVVKVAGGLLDDDKTDTLRLAK